jgi:hypothetical protein
MAAVADALNRRVKSFAFLTAAVWLVGPLLEHDLEPAALLFMDPIPFNMYR